MVNSVSYIFAVADPSPVDSQPVGGSTGSTGSIPATQSQFHVDDINTTSLTGLSTHLQINPQVVALYEDIITNILSYRPACGI